MSTMPRSAGAPVVSPEALIASTITDTISSTVTPTTSGITTNGHSITTATTTENIVTARRNNVQWTTPSVAAATATTTTTTAVPTTDTNDNHSNRRRRHHNNNNDQHQQHELNYHDMEYAILSFYAVVKPGRWNYYSFLWSPNGRSFCFVFVDPVAQLCSIDNSLFFSLHWLYMVFPSVFYDGIIRIGRHLHLHTRIGRCHRSGLIQYVQCIG
jgi:hypothetical protein